jgi:hypothetical protein
MAWQTPLLTALTTADARVLTSIFTSLSREMARMEGEIESLKKQLQTVPKTRG